MRMARTSCRALVRQGFPQVAEMTREIFALNEESWFCVTATWKNTRVQFSAIQKRNLRLESSLVSSRQDNSEFYIRERTITGKSEVRFLSQSTAEKAEHFCRNISLVNFPARDYNRTFLISCESRRLGGARITTSHAEARNYDVEQMYRIINEVQLTTSNGHRVETDQGTDERNLITTKIGRAFEGKIAPAVEEMYVSLQ